MTAAKLSLPWDTWVPTTAGLTIGDGTLTGQYVQLDDLVVFRFAFDLGSTSAVTGETTFSLPVTAASVLIARPSVNVTEFRDSGANTSYPGYCRLDNTTTGNIRAINTAGTYAVSAALSATVPFTWATGDDIYVQGWYRAA